MESIYIEIFKKVNPFTMCGGSNIRAAISAVKRIAQEKILGDIVECGVYRGGMVMSMILAMQEFGIEREVYLYDTYSGMPEPAEWEHPIKTDKMAIDKFNTQKRKDGTSDWCRAELDEVKSNVASLGYNPDKVHFVKGLVEETLVDHPHEEISILRIDTDWYSPTKTVMEKLYPKLQKGGILFLDDYGYWTGAKKGIDEFLEENKLSLNFEKVGKSSCMVIK